MEIGPLSYSLFLVHYNPWRWKEHIEANIRRSDEKTFFLFYHEICVHFEFYKEMKEEDFQWGFREIFKKRVINPDVEIQKFGKRGLGIADHFVNQRKKIISSHVNDIHKVYTLWKQIGTERGFEISFYPEKLNEIFE